MDAGDGGTFALLVYDPVAALPPARSRQAVADATRWAAELAEAGVLVSGEKLAGEGRRLVLRDNEIRQLPDFPPSGDTAVLGGFFMIRAGSYDEAQRIAADCPLLGYGSTIEIRALEEV
jgi:hypothetical protein